MNDKLWDISDIAAWIDVSKDTVRRHLLSKSTFPKAVMIPTGRRSSHRRWVPVEVKKWVLRHRG
jgi:predicted DNA-binding transcriptional regulator AlpA